MTRPARTRSSSTGPSRVRALRRRSRSTGSPCRETRCARERTTTTRFRCARSGSRMRRGSRKKPHARSTASGSTGKPFFLSPWLPPVTDVHVGTDGSAWLRREDVPGTSVVRWEILGPDGERVGVVDVRRTLSLRAVRGAGGLGDRRIGGKGAAPVAAAGPGAPTVDRRALPDRGAVNLPRPWAGDPYRRSGNPNPARTSGFRRRIGCQPARTCRGSSTVTNACGSQRSTSSSTSGIWRRRRTV